MDELEQPVEDIVIGGESFYVFDDYGFRRHIEAETVDRQVLYALQEMIQGHEDLIAEGTMKMLGQEDIFTKAMIEQSLKNSGTQMEELLLQGIPEDARAYLGMMGFRIKINHHGDVLEIRQPAAEDPEE
ncbi:MAG: hypothetical protein JXA25_05500 [Anaerolineales bacterium]|nr:hypothetical protein [Anaerolineales bacterium]